MPHTTPVLHQLLSHAVAQQASDLHLSAGSAPMLRQHGALVPLEIPHAAPEALTHDALRMMLTPEMDETQHAQFNQGHEVDFAFAIPDLGRFRVNAFMQQHGCGAVLRHIPAARPRWKR